MRRAFSIIFVLLVVFPAALHGQSTSGGKVVATPAPLQPQLAAGVTRINFTEYPVGTYVTTQYEKQGVIFSGSSPFITTDASDQYSPVLSGSPLFFGSITVTFVDPNNPSTPALADNVSFPAGYFNTVDSTTVTYFDLNGKTITTAPDSQLGIETFTAPGPIHGFTIAITGSEPYGFAIGYLDFQIETERIEAQNVTQNPPLKAEYATVGSDAAKTATLPLGSTFQIKLQQLQADGTYKDVPSGFSLGSAQLSGSVDSSALFSGEAAFKYTNQVNNAAVFQAVHLGKQELTITPNDTSLSPVKLTISVENPQTLGSSHTSDDPYIFAVSNATGVPPQMVKGQIRKETLPAFNRYTWRYEPLSRSVGDREVSRRANLRYTATPYTLLRLPTIGDSVNPGNCGKKYGYLMHVDSRIPDKKCIGLSQGADFSQQVMDQIATTYARIVIPNRDAKTGALTSGTVELSATDRYVSAADVYLYSNSKYHWTNNTIKSYAKKLAFTAQFSLASSYGWLQVTYVEAIRRAWKGTGGCGPSNARDPYNLFDTPCSLAAHASSLWVGTRITEGNFAKLYGAHPSLKDQGGLDTLFAKAFERYNSGQAHYGTDVVKYSKSYEPVPANTIFAAGGQP